MPDEPDELAEAVARAEDAFNGPHSTQRAAFNGLLGVPEYEDGLDPDDHDSDVIQLRKACRLLDACRLLREHNGYHTGYHTSVIEMAFAAIERTLEFYVLTASNDSIDDFREGHDRGAELALISEETSRRMKQLYRDNRAAAYYRDTVAAAQQADVMFEVAVMLHDYVKNFAPLSHECQCRR